MSYHEVSMNAPALKDAKTDHSTKMLVNGTFVDGDSGTFVPVLNPFDNSEICRVESASPDQVTQALEAAHRAFRAPSWQSLSGRERGALLYRLAEILRRDIEIFATLESMDTGIPIRETRMEVSTSALHIEYF